MALDMRDNGATVIQNLNQVEKQAYGDTLISVVAEQRYPLRVLQATMCEEKKSLKERLITIMNHTKKSKRVIIVSVLLLGFVIFCAVYLGAGVGRGKGMPPNLYISTEEEITKVACLGSYDWLYRGTHTHADALHPVDFEYKLENTVSVTPNQQLIISTQKLKADKKYGFTLGKLSVYKGGKLIEFTTAEPSFMNDALYLQGPPEVGEYIYSLVLNFKDKGTVNYGFVVKTEKEALNSEIATPNTKIDVLLSQIMSSPKESSKPGEYIAAHKEEYDAIIKMDIEALPYLFSEFEKGGQTGLKGHILESLCRKILGGEDIKYASENPQDWYDNYKAHLRSIAKKNSLEFVKKNYPKGLLVLSGVDLNVNHEIVNFADEQVEIAGRKLNYKAADLAPLYEKIGAARVEQMMYRAVTFYEAAFTHDYDTVNRLANQQLKDELQRWADNKSKKEDNSAMPIMKLDNYTDVAFPTGIMELKPTLVESDQYLVVLEIAKDIQVQMSFEIRKEGNPLVASFSLIRAGRAQN
jgi:hypothetical protein